MFSAPLHFYVSVVVFFTVLLPGALMSFLGLEFAQKYILGSILPAPKGEIANAIAFIVAAYVLGYFVFALGSYLDPLYDCTYRDLKRRCPRYSMSFRLDIPLAGRCDIHFAFYKPCARLVASRGTRSAMGLCVPATSRISSRTLMARKSALSCATASARRISRSGKRCVTRRCGVRRRSRISAAVSAKVETRPPSPPPQVARLCPPGQLSVPWAEAPMREISWCQMEVMSSRIGAMRWPTSTTVPPARTQASACWSESAVPRVS